jgi:hypothetical protein
LLALIGAITKKDSVLNAQSLIMCRTNLKQNVSILIRRT